MGRTEKDIWKNNSWKFSKSDEKPQIQDTQQTSTTRNKTASVQFSSVVSDSSQPHGLQHARLPCSSPTPGACSISCPSSQWCHPTIYLILCRPLLLLPSICPSIRVFSNESALCIKWPKLMFSFNISPFTEYSGLTFFRTDWFVFLQSKGLSRVFSNTTV